MDHANRKYNRQVVRAILEAIWAGNITELTQIVASCNEEQHTVDWSMAYKSQTCMNQAVELLSTEICALLIDAGADVNSHIDNLLSPLVRACEVGSLEIVRLLLAKGAYVDSPTETGRTPLSTACHYGHAAIVSVLLSAGACVDYPDNELQTPLFIAAKAGHCSIIYMLCRQGAEPNACTLRKESVLMAACSQGHYRSVETLLLAGCNPDLTDMNHCTALMLAVKAGHSSCAKLLLQNSADCLILDNRSTTPLLAAVINQSHECVLALVSSNQGKACLDIPDYQMTTPIFAAVQKCCQYFNFSTKNSSMDIIQLLIDNHCALDVSENRLGWTALFVSVHAGNFAITKFLLDNGANVNVRDKCNDSLLHAAVNTNRMDILDLILNSGCLVNSANQNNTTPLHRSVMQNCSLQMVQRLVDAGSDLDCVELTFGFTPLLSAIESNNTQAALYLLQQGCDVNKADTSGSTALTKALYRCNMDVVKELFKLDNCDTNKGTVHLPLHTAVTRTNEKWIETLLEKGADINKTTRMGIRPIQIAIEANQRRIISRLVSLGCSLDETEGSHLLVPKSCCSQHNDPHPHAELQPLFGAIKYDDVELVKNLLGHYYRQPSSQIRIIHDMLTICQETDNRMQMMVGIETRAQLITLFRHELEKPWTLKALSRGSLRQALGTFPVGKVKSLPLPLSLMRYVLYDRDESLDLTDLDDVRIQ